LGKLILEQVVKALNDVGIRAERACPGRIMPAITDIAAAVSLGESEIREKPVTVLVTVLAPASMGAAACEDAALEAGEVLRVLGGECNIRVCRFDGRTGLFSTAVTAAFSRNMEIRMESKDLKHVVSMEAWRAVDEEISSIDGALWYFRLEEFIPWGEEADSNVGEPFSLKNGKVTFTGCRWTSYKRITEANGITQIREGYAGNWEIE